MEYLDILEIVQSAIQKHPILAKLNCHFSLPFGSSVSINCSITTNSKTPLELKAGIFGINKLRKRIFAAVMKRNGKVSVTLNEVKNLPNSSASF